MSASASIVTSTCNDDDNDNQQQQHHLLLCRPVGFYYPLSLAEKNALTMNDDDFPSTRTLIPECDDDNNNNTTSVLPLAASGTTSMPTRQKSNHNYDHNNNPIIHNPTKSNSSRRWQHRKQNARKIRKKARFRLFAEWLIETYGVDYLTSSSSPSSSSSSSTLSNDSNSSSSSSSSSSSFSRGRHVIDVAGGRGRMALELAMDRHIPCFVVDPIFVTFSIHTTRRIMNLVQLDYHSTMKMVTDTTKDETSTTTIDNQQAVTATTMATTGDTTQQHEGDNNKIINNDNNNKPFILLNTAEFHRIKDHNILQHTNVYMNKIGFAYHSCLFNSDYVENNLEVWNQASIVIGMHPDEATECIVDQALLANKSFAVVPCCVFPTLFPNRTITSSTIDDNGIQQQTISTTPVRTLDQFIVYLCAKDTRIQTHILDDMEGSNTVVYMKVKY